MSKSDKLPSLQWYPGDWKKDSGVQALSFHDRGVWFEMLMLMHESEQRGKLLLNGKPMPPEGLAKILGLDNQSLTTTLTTLSTYGVSSLCEETGALMCRRMVNDEKLRMIRKNCGKLGGNPNLLNQISNQTVTTGDNQTSTPSSSSSSSIKKNEESIDKKKKRKRSTPLPPDNDWLTSLETSGIYPPAINVRFEFSRAKEWYAENSGTEVTRLQFTNWLGRNLKRLPPSAKPTELHFAKSTGEDWDILGDYKASIQSSQWETRRNLVLSGAVEPETDEEKALLCR